MDLTKKIEETISKIKSKKKSTDLNHGATRVSDKGPVVSLYSAIMTVPNRSVNAETSSKDVTMEEFDQFLLHKELEKSVEGKIRMEENFFANRHDIENDLENQNETVNEAAEEEKEDYGNICTDEELDEGISDNAEGKKEDPEYLFPSPDEITTTQPPKEGMVFSSPEEAARFINVYGQLNGFAVIRGRNYKQRKITLVCNKRRITKSRASGKRTRRSNLICRTDCKMNVVVQLVDAKWHITYYFLEHNHDLVASPSLTKFFLSHRTMSSEEKMLSQLLQDIRVKPQKIMTIFRKLKGGCGNVKFGKKMLDNLKQSDRKAKKNSDIAYTMRYIEKLQLRKPGFCCKMESDSEDVVKSLFWTDARSRLDYKLYGEIVCFDTTYSTNKYNMPFAPIIGINGHGKTIVFGWALLKDQRTKSFEWLFESFIEVMEGKKAKLILTDQDQAMKNTISKIFPDAWHRFCIWHIFKCLRENMSSYMAENEGMEDCILNLIMESLNVNEFEAGWKEMLVTYKCADHVYLSRLWDARSMFVPAYFKGNFCPFTRTTGRSESFNSNFKDYVKRKDTIETFMKQYEIFQENTIEVENEDRFQSTQKEPSMWGYYPIERHAASIYTRGIYDKFVTEMVSSTAFAVHEVVKDKIYELKKMFYYKNPEYRKEIFSVCVDRTTMTIECECGKFEKDGLLCCHILRLFNQWDITKIPDQYIVPRWTTKYRETELLKHKQEEFELHGTNVPQNALRYAMLMNTVSDLCADISVSSAKSKEFIDEVQKLHKKLMTDDGQTSEKPSSSTTLKDPTVIKKASLKKSKELDSEVGTTSVTPSGPNVNIWVHADGSTSRSVQVTEQPTVAKKTSKKKKQESDDPNCLQDPAVSNAKSVVKGNRMKPQ